MFPVPKTFAVAKDGAGKTRVRISVLPGAAKPAQGNKKNAEKFKNLKKGLAIPVK